MKIERTKNATRNIVFNGSLQLINMFIPFIMRLILLHTLGVEYLGLNGLFRSILTFLGLAELGIGSAMVFSMYKPIAEDDADTICALMKLYRMLYRIIGLIVLFIGLLLIPFLHNLIKEEPSADINLNVLYLMTLASTVASYWMFAYKNCLLDAHQRRDVSSKITMCTSLAEYSLKILSLVIFRNYYLYLGIQIISQISSNILVALRVNKMFPDYHPRGDLPKEKVIGIFRRVRDLFTSKLSYVISSSADTLVISAFLGLTVLARYQNYYFIIESLKAMITVIVGACMAGIGNSLVVESAEKNYNDFCKMTILFGWLMNVTTPMLLCMYQPFMTIWMGEENLLAVSYVVCFAIYYYAIGMNRLTNMFKDAAGIWQIDKYRPLTAALVNLCLNLATVKWLGLYGVLLSTVIAIVIVQTPWLFHNLFRTIFPREHLWQYVRFFCGFVIITLCSCAVTWLTCSYVKLGVWPAFLFNAGISLIIPNIIFLAVYGKNKLFKDSITQLVGAVLNCRR